MSTTPLPSDSTGESGGPAAPGTAAATDAIPAVARHKNRLHLGLVLGAALVVALAIAVPVLHVIAQSDYDAARKSLAFKQSTVAPLVDATRSTLADATALLDESDGHVLDETPRTQLAAAIAEADRRVVVVEKEIAASVTAATAEPQASVLLAGFPLRHGVSTLEAFALNDAGELAEIESNLAPPMSAVTDAVAAWETEQKRLRFTKDVYAAGWYPELDACLGPVDLTKRYGVATIAEHWSCGGRDFPDDAGTLIELTGLNAGTYRVEGIVAMLDQSTATTADLPRGYDLLYQTCQNGQSSTMSMTALTKVD
ncbi:hypothetical protein GCM10022381_32700 [Leifsonia kafniensis]|uniref:DUF4012 domain-containing protein n=1 Tax=Leifsonia kafniensis TaxID=475957 RepID=A0ABP7KUA8_9MICO